MWWFLHGWQHVRQFTNIFPQTSNVYMKDADVNWLSIRHNWIEKVKKLKAFTAAILFKVVNILLHLARLSLKLADMIFKVLVLNSQCLYLLICRVKMFLHLLVLVGQELLALSNLPHLFYQLDKGAAVIDKSFWHLVKFTIDVFDINFRCRSIHASQQHSGWDEQYYKSKTNRSQPVQTDDGSKCFWIENQYRTDRAVKAILSHFTI